jgi:uncharacterized protein
VAAPVVHFEVIGKDYETLAGFYRELFGWEPQKTGPADYGVVEPGDGIGGGLGAAPEPYGVTFYVQVTDLEAVLRRAEELGGGQLMPPTQVSDTLSVAHLEDPEGHRIGLVQG